MNEPSVFDGPEITMPGQLIHRSATGTIYEHREIHNMYGLLMHMATFQGQQQAHPKRRPFVLTRSFFAGSQKYAAVWTGDNKASWAHLAATTPMLLALSVAGIPFVGADVGGFFGNPSTKLLVRWYQVAIFHPFLRAHAEFKTKRREPYLFGSEVTRQIREALALRYSLLPYLYTLFAEHATDGSLVMRPMWWEFPHDPNLRGSAWWMANDSPLITSSDVEPSPDSLDEMDVRATYNEDPSATERTETDDHDEIKGADELDELIAEVACKCYKCDDSLCYSPTCEKCGPKDASGCVTPADFGCYTTSESDCSCSSTEGQPPATDESVAEAEAEGFKDYNAEYYQGKVKDGEQDETQPQTGEQFMLGPNLLVHPVTTIEIHETRVYLPAPEPLAAACWFDLHTAAKLVTTPSSRVATVAVHPDRIPVFLRGGAVLPKRERLRRSTQATHTDPFTLIVAPDLANRSATGTLFLDDYDGYESGRSLTVRFFFDGKTLYGKAEKIGAAGVPQAALSMVERVIFYGQWSARSVVVHSERHARKTNHGIETFFDAATETLTVRQPRVSVGEDWSMELVRHAISEL